MDPDAVLTEIRETIRLINVDADAGIDTALDRLDWLAAQFETLDNWITQGGFLPADWVNVSEE